MADWQTYQYSDLPIPVPSVDLAWQDMQSRLDGKKRRPVLPWISIAMTLALLLSWLVIVEPVPYEGKPVATLPSSGVATGALSAQPNNGTQNNDLPVSSAPGQKSLLAYTSPLDQHNKQKKKPRPGKNETPDIQELPSTGSISDDDVTPALVEEKTTPNTSDTLTAKTTKSPDTTSSANASPDKEEKKEDEKWKIRFGPHWELQLPTTGFSGYFDGPSIKPEPWRNLIPGLWLEAVHGKDAIHFSFMPMHQQMVSDKTFRIQNSLIQNPDTTISREETKQLYKLLGMSASIGYARNLHGNWWGGLTFQATRWQDALARSDVQDSYIVSGQVVDTKSSSYAYKVTDEWSYFNRVQTFMLADLTYRKQRWQSGFRSGIALTPLSKGDGPSNMFRASVFFRWSFGK